ncbi:MAG TPA: hypothetical protein VF796_06030 [Humisphaera sp.]
MRHPIRTLVLIAAVAALARPAEPPARAADIDRPATRPSTRPNAVVITLAEDGKRVVAAVRQQVRVSLKGDRRQTGWEVGQPRGTALTPVVVGGTVREAIIPAAEFWPAQDDVDDLGDYDFLDDAIAPGTSELSFAFVYPGGSKPTARIATKRVREFQVTVVVGDAAAGGATSKPAPGVVAVAPAAEGQPQVTVLRGTGIPQVDHNAVVDTAKYNMVDERDNLTRYAVRANGVSRAFLARYRGAKPVVVTGTVERDGALEVIVPTEVVLQPVPVKKAK